MATWENYPLLPDNDFQDDSDFLPVHANIAIRGPFYTGQNALGHREKIADEELSDSPTALKARVALLDSGLRITGTSGLNVTHNAGTVVLPNGNIQAVAGGTITAPNNATSFLFVNSSGVVQVSTNPPVVRALIGRIVASAGSISVAEDLRNTGFLSVRPQAEAIRTIGGQSTQDKTAIQGEIFNQGLYYYRDFVVPSGVTIIVRQNAKFICSGNVTIQGTITVEPSAQGGVSAVVTTPALYAAPIPGQGLGGSGNPYGWGSQQFGSGGSSGTAISPSGNSWALLGAGGNGGGGIIFEVSGNFTLTSTGIINAIGGNGLQGGSAWTPGTFTTNYWVNATGGSGGSGGFIGVFVRGSLTAQGTLSVRGGDGGNGYVYNPGGNNGTAALGGAPGSGGVIVLQSPNLNTAGLTTTLTPGLFGTDVGPNVTTTNQSTVVISNSGGWIVPGPSGCFGGGRATYTSSFASGNTTISKFTTGMTGLLFTSNAIPVG